MIKIPVNKFNILELEPHKINEVNDKDRYFNVYLSGRNLKREMIAEIKINLKDDKKSTKKIKKKGGIVHPAAFLVLDRFMNDYKDD